MIVKKLVKPISKIGIAEASQYTGIAPINVNINNRQISIDLSNIALLNRENTFTNNQNINAELKVGNPNGNRLQLWNFDYANNNYSALKFIKGESTNLLQIQVNNDTNEATISSPNLKIMGIQNPTNNNDAANKQYVDSSIGDKVNTSDFNTFKEQTNQKIQDNTNTIDLNEGRIEGLEADTRGLNTRLTTAENNITQLISKTTTLENEQRNLQADVSANTNAITSKLFKKITVNNFNDITQDGIYGFTSGNISNAPRGWQNNPGGILIVNNLGGNNFQQVLFPSGTYGRFWIRVGTQRWYRWNGEAD